MARISFFVHDLSLTPIGRAYPIARALEKLGHSVEVLGLLIESHEIYYPYRNLLQYRTLKSSGYLPDIFLHTAQLAKMANGDIIYAFKPLWTSLWPALLASSFGKSKPMILDVEDEELLFTYQGAKDFVYRRLMRGWLSPLSWQYRVLLHPLSLFASQKTVVSSYLQRRYGGEILLHGPDEELFNPLVNAMNTIQFRKKWSLPLDVPIATFVGSPHKHKGLEILVEALQMPQTREIHLVLGGDEKHPQFQAAKVALGSRCHLIGYIPNIMMPEILALSDIIPIPQLDTVFAQAQIPAKLLEAMSMAKPIVASAISDIPQILGQASPSPRGWVVQPGNVNELALVLNEIVFSPDEAQRRGAEAREYYLQNASIDAIGKKLSSLLNFLLT